MERDSLKSKFNMLSILAWALLTSSLITYGVFCYYDSKIDKEVKANLAEHEITIDADEVDAKTVQESEDDSTVYDIGEDQKVKKVKSYVNVMDIPALNIKAYIYDGIGHDALTYGVGRYTNSAKLGANGNIVIAGHSSDIYNCILNGIHKIKAWTKILIYDGKGKKHTYYVVDTDVIEPTNMTIFNQINKSYNQLTLFTCTEKGTKRFVVYAYEFNDVKKLREFKKSKNSSLYNDLISVNESFVMERLTEELDFRSKGYSLKVKEAMQK
jgi:LPXTG-site transpeptidase (sortase) family protein